MRAHFEVRRTVRGWCVWLVDRDGDEWPMGYTDTRAEARKLRSTKLFKNLLARAARL